MFEKKEQIGEIRSQAPCLLKVARLKLSSVELSYHWATCPWNTRNFE